MVGNIILFDCTVIKKYRNMGFDLLFILHRTGRINMLYMSRETTNAIEFTFNLLLVIIYRIADGR